MSTKPVTLDLKKDKCTWHKYNHKSREHRKKFLSAIINDNTLSQKAQIQSVKSKLAKTISIIIYKSRCLLDVNSRSLLYFLLFMPYIHYGSEIWATRIFIIYGSYLVYENKLYELYMEQKLKTIQTTCLLILML